MNKTHLSLILVLLGLNSYLFAQIPQAFNYHAVAKDANSVVLSNQSIAIRISILQGNENGTTAYSEVHNITTNTQGLFSLNVGTGINPSSNFANIQWGSSIHYLKVEMDANGQGFQNMGASQLLSVPYALHAQTAGNNANMNNNATLQIGDEAHGGIVFWLDESGEHGLVTTTFNLTFEPVAGFPGQAAGDFIYAGERNTMFYLYYLGFNDHGSPTLHPVKLCAFFNGGNYGDWYLPAKYELNLMYQNLKLTNQGDFGNFQYWSSTGGVDASIWFQNFGSGEQLETYDYSTVAHVRPVRRF